MKTVEYKTGSVIFSQGEVERCMYSIRSGKVGIFVNRGGKDEEKLTELGEGKFFGELALLDDMPRSATAVVLEDTSLDEMTAEDLEQLYQDAPDMVLNIMQSLSGRLRQLTAEYLSACKTVAELSEAADGVDADVQKKVDYFSGVAAQ